MQFQCTALRTGGRLNNRCLTGLALQHACRAGAGTRLLRQQQEDGIALLGGTPKAEPSRGRYAKRSLRRDGAKVEYHDAETAGLQNLVGRAQGTAKPVHGRVGLLARRLRSSWHCDHLASLDRGELVHLP